MGRAFEFRKARKMKRWSNMAKTFTRIGREIIIAVKDSGPDPSSNSKLRAIIQNAKAANMPKDNIERAIKKGEGSDPDSNYEEIRYEGYGPDGIAIIVEAMTNNKNRTAAEIRTIFSKSGGNLGESGSVSFGFRRLGEILIEKKLASEDDLFEFLVENNSNDLESNEDEYIIYCDPSALHELNEKVISEFGQTTSVQLVWKGDTTIQVDKESAEKLFKLLNILEDNEDVQVVSSNFEVSEEILLSLT